MKKALISATCKSTLALLLLGGVTNFVSAQNKVSLPDPASMLGSEGKARAGSTVASEMGYSALAINPAAAAFVEQYELSLGYIGAGRTLRASVVDTKSSAIGGGLYYARRDTKKGDVSTKSSGDFRRVEDRASLSFFGRAAETVSVGAGIKWARRSGSPAGVSNENASVNADIGAVAKLNEDIHLGGSVLNVLDGEKGIHPRMIHVGVEKSFQKVFKASFGISFIEKPSEASIFILPGDKSFIWSIGAEYRFKQIVGRAGFKDNAPWDERWLNAGVGFEGESFSVSYTIEGLVKGAGQTLHNVGIDVRF